MANMKFKSKKSSRSLKGKPSKNNSFKANNKQNRKNFLEENMKTAGKTSSRRKSLVLSSDKGLIKDNLDNESEKTLLAEELEEKKKNTDTQINDEKEKLKLLYAKERHDLQQAYDVLLQEYHRRRAVRRNIMSKFGRASTSLKIILAHKRAWSDPNASSTRNDVIREVFVAKPMTESQQEEERRERKKKQEEENRRRFKYDRFDDVDRI